MNLNYQQYSTSIYQSLLNHTELEYKNWYQIPKLHKIVINRGIGEASQNPQIINHLLYELYMIGGQKAIITTSKKSISSFKLRQQMPVGICVTLRQKSMYTFLDRLLHLALPRIRDFQGLSPTSFDGFGNYTFGLEEQLMFPEIEYDQIQTICGMDISIVTSCNTDYSALCLLKQYGFPFQN